MHSSTNIKIVIFGRIHIHIIVASSLNTRPSYHQACLIERISDVPLFSYFSIIHWEFLYSFFSSCTIYQCHPRSDNAMIRVIIQKVCLFFKTTMFCCIVRIKPCYIFSLSQINEFVSCLRDPEIILILITAYSIVLFLIARNAVPAIICTGIIYNNQFKISICLIEQ